MKTICILINIIGFVVNLDAQLEKQVDWFFGLDQAGIQIKWKLPMEELVYTEDGWSKVELTIQTETPKSELIFRLLNNGGVLQQGQKADVVPKYQDVNLITFQNSIWLPYESNELVLQVLDKNKNVLKSSSPKTFIKGALKTNEDKRPNLYLLAIGVPFIDLKYTIEDAKDFVGIFNTQGGIQPDKLYKEVHSKLVIGSAANAYNISKSILNLQEMYYEGRIQKNDVVMLFISSHGGFDANGELIIKGYGYNPENSKSGIEYKQILNWLVPIQAQKIIFLDACHSGGISQFFTELSQNKGITIVASCKAEQLAFEDDQWKNGAFTEGIHRGLAGMQAVEKGKPGITVGGLVNFLSREVPSIVQETKDKSRKILFSQTPVLISNKDANIVIYRVGQK
ncbi:MAG: caspase family protein [Saprospiraceae bacterium]